MGIRVSRLSHTTDQWRLWGAGGVEITGTASGVSLEFTRRVGRGSATFKIEFDEASFAELAEAIEASQAAAKGSQQRRGGLPDDPASHRHGAERDGG